MPPQLSAAILAGGQGRRLGGVDKPLLIVDEPQGTRIIDLQLAELAGVADEMLIVTNRPAHYADLQVRCVPDMIPGAGALGGIYTALRAAVSPYVLVLAGDLPFVRRALLQRLATEAAGDFDLVVPRSARGLEPLCAIYAVRIAPLLKRRIDAGHLQVVSVVDELRVQELGPAVVAEYDRDGRLFDNINTPHDYARARARMEN